MSKIAGLRGGGATSYAAAFEKSRLLKPEPKDSIEGDSGPQQARPDVLSPESGPKQPIERDAGPQQARPDVLSPESDPGRWLEAQIQNLQSELMEIDSKSSALKDPGELKTDRLKRTGERILRLASGSPKNAESAPETLPSPSSKGDRILLQQLKQRLSQEQARSSQMREEGIRNTKSLESQAVTIKRLHAQLAASSAAMRARKEELDALKKARKGDSGAQVALEKARETIKKLKSQRNEAKGAVTTLGKEKSDVLRDCSRLREEAAKLKARLSAVKEAKRTLETPDSEAIASWRERMRAEQDKAAALAAKNGELERALGRARQELDVMRMEKEALARETKRLNACLAKAETADVAEKIRLLSEREAALLEAESSLERDKQEVKKGRVQVQLQVEAIEQTLLKQRLEKEKAKRLSQRVLTPQEKLDALSDLSSQQRSLEAQQLALAARERVVRAAEADIKAREESFLKTASERDRWRGFAEELKGMLEEREEKESAENLKLREKLAAVTAKEARMGKERAALEEAKAALLKERAAVEREGKSAANLDEQKLREKLAAVTAKEAQMGEERAALEEAKAALLKERAALEKKAAVGEKEVQTETVSEKEARVEELEQRLEIASRRLAHSLQAQSQLQEALAELKADGETDVKKQKKREGWITATEGWHKELRRAHSLEEQCAELRDQVTVLHQQLRRATVVRNVAMKRAGFLEGEEEETSRESEEVAALRTELKEVKSREILAVQEKNQLLKQIIVDGSPPPVSPCSSPRFAETERLAFTSVVANLETKLKEEHKTKEAYSVRERALMREVHRLREELGAATKERDRLAEALQRGKDAEKGRLQQVKELSESNSRLETKVQQWRAFSEAFTAEGSKKLASLKALKREKAAVEDEKRALQQVQFELEQEAKAYLLALHEQETELVAMEKRVGELSRENETLKKILLAMLPKPRGRHRTQDHIVEILRSGAVSISPRHDPKQPSPPATPASPERRESPLRKQTTKKAPLKVEVGGRRGFFYGRQVRRPITAEGSPFIERIASLKAASAALKKQKQSWGNIVAPATTRVASPPMNPPSESPMNVQRSRQYKHVFGGLMKAKKLVLSPESSKSL